MPVRKVVSKELANVLKVIAHPDRVRIIEELRLGEMDVNTLCDLLELPGPRVSQHLSLLRAHRIVSERRDGRHHYYYLVEPEFADWVADGLRFLEGRVGVLPEGTINDARKLWSVGTP